MLFRSPSVHRSHRYRNVLTDKIDILYVLYNGMEYMGHTPRDQSHASGSALAFGQFLRRFSPKQTTRKASQTRSSPQAPGEGQLTLNNPQDLSQMLTQRFEENSGHVASTEVNNNNKPNGQKQGNPAANVHYRLDSLDLGGYSLWLASLSHGWSLQDLSPLD